MQTQICQAVYITIAIDPETAIARFRVLKGTTVSRDMLEEEMLARANHHQLFADRLNGLLFLDEGGNDVSSFVAQTSQTVFVIPTSDGEALCETASEAEWYEL